MRVPVREIDDGFNEPVATAKSAVANGDNQSPSGSAEPKRTPEMLNGFPVVDSFIAGIDPAGSEPRRRGRPKGSRNNAKSEEKAPPVHLALTADLESLLISAHLMVVPFIGPEMMLDPSEAKRLSDAIKELAKFYPMGLDPKKFAWVQFSMAAIGIYGPRAVAIYKRHSEDAPPKPAQPEGPRPAPKPEAVKTAPTPISKPKLKNMNEMSPSELWNEPPTADSGL